MNAVEELLDNLDIKELRSEFPTIDTIKKWLRLEPLNDTEENAIGAFLLAGLAEMRKQHKQQKAEEVL